MTDDTQPPMQQDWHPDHVMPPTTAQPYYGTMLSDSVIKTAKAYGRIFNAIKDSK